MGAAAVVRLSMPGISIRASRESAIWCAETIKLLWKNRNKIIAAQERLEAEQTYQRSIRTYLQRAEEAVRTN